jgi:hypothetical protein
MSADLTPVRVNAASTSTSLTTIFLRRQQNCDGYREDNWSLPRAQQLIHARQNIFDGT